MKSYFVANPLDCICSLVFSSLQTNPSMTRLCELTIKAINSQIPVTITAVENMPLTSISGGVQQQLSATMPHASQWQNQMLQQHMGSTTTTVQSSMLGIAGIGGASGPTSPVLSTDDRLVQQFLDHIFQIALRNVDWQAAAFSQRLQSEFHRLTRMGCQDNWAYCMPDWRNPQAVIYCEDSKRTFDAQMRVHNLQAPAIIYPGPLEIYAVHGVLVPSEWITLGLRPEDALQQSNVELRRAACEIVGWDKILSGLSAKLIDEDSDPEIGSLWEADIPGLGRERFLRVRCGTGRQFVIPVPPNTSTALAGNAWTYDIDQQLAKVETRT